MQFRFKPFLPLTGLIMLCAGLGQDAQAQRASQSVAGELLVCWKSQRAPLVLAPGAPTSRYQQSGLQAQVSAKIPGSKLKKSFGVSGWSLISLPAGQNTAQARAALVKTLGAANVSLNYRRYATRTPNDASYSSQWQWPKIKAPDAWNTATGSRDVVVAVLDTGIDLNHADIQANLWRNPREVAGNGVDDDGNGYVDDVFGLDAIAPTTSPQDENGHGTHCAGLIGAVGNNGGDVTGINWSVKVMALRFLDAKGEGSDADAIACLEYAIKMKQSGVNLKAISNSYAGPDDNPAFKEAYQAAERAGILNICAAGNNSTDIDTKGSDGNYATDEYGNYLYRQFPAGYTSSTNIAVAASSQDDSLASFSNFGSESIDIAAPGVQIPSLRLGGGIVQISGTSMATPIIAGAAALVASNEPTLSASALKSRLISTVDKISGLQGLVKSGGRLNLARAVVPVGYTLKGQVYRLNGSTKVPLSGATVSLSGAATASAVTPANGSYSFGNLARGTYTLKVTLQGYTFETLTRAFPTSSGATSTTVDFKATSAPTTFYTLFGTARDAVGVAVPGVSIALSSAPTVVVATTDASGKYTISNRPRGTYTLKATGGNFKWTATPGSIALPEGAINGRAEVNLKGVLTDRAAPSISIATPADGGIFAPGNQIASGKATDTTGNKEIYLQLFRMVNFVPSYYDWVARTWVSDRTANTILTRAVSGKITNWSATLPGMSAANYSLRVWGRDTLGNVSKGEADAFSSFSVVKPSSSAPAGNPSSGGAS